MKNLLRFLIIYSSSLVLMYGCKKSDNTPSTPSDITPVITSFSPIVTGVGYTVTITGKNFSETAQENTVTINGVPVTVSSSTSTELKVSFSDAAAGKISTAVNGKTATSTNDILIKRLYPVTFAGTGMMGSNDGINTAATFNGIWGIALDADGNLFIADTYNNKIRKITPTGTVSTFAGTGMQGNTDGPGSSATFSNPFGITIDKNGIIYVSNSGYGTIRKITPDGTVSTIAGNNYGQHGFADGTGSSAKFNYPLGMVTDADNNIYVADAANNAIRKITPDGVVTTLAGNGTSGNANGAGAAATFNQPLALAMDASNNLLVTEEGNFDIRKITLAGEVTTFAGSGVSGSADGPAATATFNVPVGITIDTQGNIYISDSNNGTIRIITPSGIVGTLAGNGDKSSTDGIGFTSSFDNPLGIAINENGQMYILDNASNKVRIATIQ